MTEVMQAIESFLACLGIPVYPENGIPADAVFPFISYSPVQVPWDSQALMPVRIWDRSYNYRRLAGLVDRLAEEVGQGRVLPTESGYVCLYPGDPWAQPQPSANSEVKQMYINVGINTFIST